MPAAKIKKRKRGDTIYVWADDVYLGRIYLDASLPLDRWRIRGDAAALRFATADAAIADMIRQHRRIAAEIKKA